MTASRHRRGAHRAGRRHLVPLVWLGGLSAAGLLAVSVNGTLAGFTASIDNNVNVAGSGTLIMSESGTGSPCFSSGTAAGGTVTASNSATCAIDKFGATGLVPGVAGTPVTVTIKNAGNIPANTFTLTPDGACVQSNNTAGTPANTYFGSAVDFCSKITVDINAGSSPGTSLFTGSAAALGTHAAFVLGTPVAPGASVQFTFRVTLASAADNTYQGLAAKVGMTWAFAQ